MQTMEVLREGVVGRTTAATGMNATSSRSHAIFSIEVAQTRVAAAAVSMDASGDSAALELQTEASGEDETNSPTLISNCVPLCTQNEIGI